MCIDCQVKLLNLEGKASVSFVSFRNLSEIQCSLLVSKYVKIMSVVSLKNPSELR